MLCTLVMTANTDLKGVARYPVGILPYHAAQDRNGPQGADVERHIGGAAQAIVGSLLQHHRHRRFR